MIEFTGERVVPGQVPPDLWNEHLARYIFAARLAKGKRILDIGCGLGYGSAELARTANAVVGVDVSDEAIAEATRLYSLPNLTFRTGSADQLPFPDASFDLIVAFEVIEHLPHWEPLLTEARRLLAPAGQFMVSTPNRTYYEDSRREHGPNPYHVHEFEHDEFDAALRGIFPSVRLFFQNHVAAIVFQPSGATMSPAAEISVDRRAPSPSDSHFFVAVCAMTQQTGAPTYFYVPATSNVLREREKHIELLEQEVTAKTKWLEQSQAEHAGLLRVHQQLSSELEKRTKWASDLQEEINEARETVGKYQAEVDRLRAEFETERKEGAQYVIDLQAAVAEAECSRDQARLAHSDARRELEAKLSELAECVEHLHRAEKTVEERTHWALELQARIYRMEKTLSKARGSRWLRIGNKIGIGPDLSNY